jgi:hypothetical protein
VTAVETLDGDAVAAFGGGGDDGEILAVFTVEGLVSVVAVEADKGVRLGVAVGAVTWRVPVPLWGRRFSFRHAPPPRRRRA